ncbi:MAG: hypothetical protein C0394_00695 [Syntrophus sp. (in: bacteria)]|nr:hypothetical protein [Syntrophus sp. (in: bacteria)]
MHCKRFRNRIKDSRGFTLIEVIISLIVASILGVMLVSFMGSAVMQSGNPVLLAQNGAFLNQIMENMTSDYKYILSTDGSPMATFMTHVGAEGTSQNRYSVPDGSRPYTIVDNHGITFAASGSPVTETPDSSIPPKILKVTIRYPAGAGGMTLTALFTN